MRALALAFFTAAALYVLASVVFFQVPTTLAEAEACGFLPEDFQADGSLDHLSHLSAWWLAFQRQHDIFSALSIGMAAAFVVHALRVGRRAGGLRSAGAAAGGGLLAFTALCVSCLAPVMSAVGLGLAASWLVGVPKWLIAFNTLVFTLWGGLLLSRRARACPLPPSSTASPTAPKASHPGD